MKLILKSLKQVTYNIEVPSEKTTILELKKEIEKVHEFDSTQIKLLFTGAVLKDEKTLEDYKIKEGDFIIMVTAKVKPKNVDSQQNKETTEPKKEEEKKEEEKKVEEKKEEKPKTVPKQENKSEEKYTTQLNSLIEMGIEKSQAEGAIKAAKGQIDKAIDYLYNGIPEGLNDEDAQDNEHYQEGDENGEGEEEDPLKKVASIAKVLCQNNPASLTSLLQNIQQNDPDLFNLIKENEEEFKNLLEQPITEQDRRTFINFSQEMNMGGQGQGQGQGQQRIRLNLTEADKAAINRLKDLGNFSEMDVIQAYIACDKNEELTANYLFEQKMMDDQNQK